MASECINDCVHLLLKGERRNDEQQPSNDIQDEYVLEFAKKSLTAFTVPPLKFVYKNIDQLEQLISTSATQQVKLGLVITSPRAVDALAQCLKNSSKCNIGLITRSLAPELIFPVGSKTASYWKSKSSIDYNEGATRTGEGIKLAKYIREYCINVSKPVKLIYPKGNLANQSIEEILLDKTSNLSLDSIEVYETNVSVNLCDTIMEKLHDVLGHQDEQTTTHHVNLIFFSPSGVTSFLASQAGMLTSDKVGKYSKMKFLYSSIGPTTERALKENGLDVFCVSKEPNARSLADCISQVCSNSRNEYR